MVALVRVRNICFLFVGFVLLQGCASTEELFAEYDDKFCAAPEYASRTLSEEPAVYFDSVLSTQNKTPPSTQKKTPPVWQPAVYFDTDSVLLKEAALAKLQENVEALKKLTGYKISLQGFADPQGSDAYNKVLSGRRVESVREVLISDFGLSDDRIVRASSVARPASKSGTRGPVAADRRVDMILLDATLAPVATQPPVRAAASPDLKKSAL